MFDWKFYLFLYPELIKSGINSKKLAYQHWIEIGRYHNFICEHPDKNNFNWKSYLKKNKFIVKKGIIDKRNAIKHWYSYGKKYGLKFSPKNNIKLKNKYNINIININLPKNQQNIKKNKKYNKPEYNKPEYNKPEYNKPEYNNTGYNNTGYNKPEYNNMGYIDLNKNINKNIPPEKNILHINCINKKTYLNSHINKNEKIIISTNKSATNKSSIITNKIFNSPKYNTITIKQIKPIKPIKPIKIQPKVLLYYKTISQLELFYIINYYQNNKNIKIYIDNFNDKINGLSKNYNIKLLKFTNYNEIINNNTKFNYICTLKNNSLIDNDFFKKKITYCKYYNENFEIIPININIKYCNIKVKKYLNKFVIDKNVLINNIKNLKKIDHIKHKIYLKSEKYIYDHIDHIYILNLYRRDDRYKNIVKRLNEIGIYTFEHFFAIDGNDFNQKVIYRFYKNINKNFNIPSSGSLSILYSMLNMILDAKKYKYENILVFQDDIYFIKDFKKQFIKFINNVTDWKLLYLGANDKNIKNKNVNYILKKIYYHPIDKCDGAFGLIINSKIYDIIIKQILEFNLPFDSGPLKFIQNIYLNNTFVSYPNLLIADVSDSDCRLPRNQDLFSKKLLWDLNLYKINNDNHNKDLTIICNSKNKIQSIKFNNNNCDAIVITEQITESYYHENIRYYKANKIYDYMYIYCYTNFIYIMDDPSIFNKLINNFKLNSLNYLFFGIENDLKNFIVSKYYYYTIGNLKELITYMKKNDLIMFLKK